MPGRGKVDATLPTTDYIRGDTIPGTVTLTLDKPVRARELSISLIGEYLTTVTTARVRETDDGNDDQMHGALLRPKATDG
jgi:hypothetical protein